MNEGAIGLQILPLVALLLGLVFYIADRAGQVPIPLSVADNALVLRVRLDETPVFLQLDTGSALSWAPNSTYAAPLFWTNGTA